MDTADEQELATAQEKTVMMITEQRSHVPIDDGTMRVRLEAVDYNLFNMHRNVSYRE